MSALKISAPRRLTQDELTDILSVMPDINAASREISVKLTLEVKNHIRFLMHDEKICPEGISLFKQYFKESCISTVIDPGSSVGLTAAEAIGGPLIQMTLNGLEHGQAVYQNLMAKHGLLIPHQMA